MRYYNSNEYEDYSQYSNQEQVEVENEEVKCRFCWDDKKKKDRPLTFFDQANNLRTCNYCPWCGRKYSV